MTIPRNKVRRALRTAATLAGLTAALLVQGPHAASAQQDETRQFAPSAGMQAPETPPPAKPDAAPAEPNLVEKFGNVIKESVDTMSSTFRNTRESIEDANRSLTDLNKGTADTLSRLPVTGIANGRAICTRAENGAPDCRTASDKLCRDKGFKSGRSVEIQTAETCNPRVFLPGHQRSADDCRTDNYVVRAACN